MGSTLLLDLSCFKDDMHRPCCALEPVQSRLRWGDKQSQDPVKDRFSSDITDPKTGRSPYSQTQMGVTWYIGLSLNKEFALFKHYSLVSQEIQIFFYIPTGKLQFGFRLSQLPEYVPPNEPRRGRRRLCGLAQAAVLRFLSDCLMRHCGLLKQLLELEGCLLRCPHSRCRPLRG